MTCSLFPLVLSEEEKTRGEKERRRGEETRRGTQDEKKRSGKEKRELERYHTRSSSVESDGDGVLMWGWMFMFLNSYLWPVYPGRHVEGLF